MAATSPTNLLSSLPFEIKTNICEFLCDHCSEPWAKTHCDGYPFTLMRSKPLRNLCLTSKAMKDAAQPVLFHFNRLGGSNEEVLQHALKYSDTLQQSPHLAVGVKSLVVRGADDLLVLGPATFDILSNAGCLEATAKVWKTLMSDDRVEELVFTFHSHQTSSQLAFSRLRELSLACLSSDCNLDAQQISAFLAHCPNLNKLTLTNIWRFDHSISNVALSVKQLTMFYDKDNQAPDVSNIRALVEAMPRLEYFRLCSSGYWKVNGIRVKDILHQLIPRRDSLKSLTLEKCLTDPDCNTLTLFSELENLDLRVLPLKHLCGPGALKLPTSLRRLVIRAGTMWMSEFHGSGLCKLSEVASCLGSRLGSFPNLKRVHVVLNGGHRVSDIMEDFEGLGGKKAFKNWNVDISIHEVERYDEWNDYLCESSWGLMICSPNKGGYLIDEYSEP